MKIHSLTFKGKYISDMHSPIIAHIPYTVMGKLRFSGYKMSQRCLCQLLRHHNLCCCSLKLKCHNLLRTSTVMTWIWVLPVICALVTVRKMNHLNGYNTYHHTNHTCGKCRQATEHPCPSSKHQTEKLRKANVKQKMLSVYLGIG